MQWQCKVLVLLCILLMLIIVTGCTRQEEETNPVNGPNISWQRTEKQLSNCVTGSVKYGLYTKAPIMCDGKAYGFVEINQVEKLGINDWLNAKCMQANINYSYTLNMTVSWIDDFVGKDHFVISCMPYLADGEGDIVGEPCIVGWSGFPTQAVLSGGTQKVSIEYGVQPIKKLTKETQLLLVLKDSEGLQYDDIIFSNSVFGKVKNGPSLCFATSKKVNSINGGKYSVGIGKVHYENNYLYGDRESRVRAFDFSYKVAFLKLPTNKKSVDTFDRESNTMYTQAVVGLQSDISSEVMYSSVPSAYRVLYSDSSDTAAYVPIERLKIHKGCYVKYNANRILTQAMTGKPEYVRFRFEFPEEVKARTDKELLNFNGRFIVFQKKITTRKLYAEDDYDDYGNLVTSDSDAKEAE